jgi:hypothetical protein
MRIEEGSNSDDNEKYRESVRLKVGQGNGVVDGNVKGLQDRMVKVSMLDRIDARKNFGFVKAADINSGNSHPIYMFITEIG